jgi:hypothetical protein
MHSGKLATAPDHERRRTPTCFLKPWQQCGCAVPTAAHLCSCWSQQFQLLEHEDRTGSAQRLFELAARQLERCSADNAYPEVQLSAERSSNRRFAAPGPPVQQDAIAASARGADATGPAVPLLQKSAQLIKRRRARDAHGTHGGRAAVGPSSHC